MQSNRTDLEKFINILDNLPCNQLNEFVSCFVQDYEKNKAQYSGNKHIVRGCQLDTVSTEYSDSPNVFLSVVVRTQGNRPQSLQQNFDSLKEQINQNFEVVLVCHKASIENKKVLDDLINSQDPEFRKKIQVYYLEDGNRTAPLNYGFSVSKGQYIAVLDDDDIALNNWVDEFYQAAKEHNGNILHAFVEEQLWHYDENKNIVKVKADKQEYCEKFSIHSQLELNRCPINGLAFPSYVFKSLYVSFDESMSTNEDWDFLMRSSFITGVYDIEKVTAIYVRWKEQSNAYVEHSEDEWKKNISCLKKKFENMPILYPAGEEKSQVRYEWKPINFYHLFKIYKRTILLGILCPLSLYAFKKLNQELKDNRELLKRIKNNEKDYIYRL